MYPFSTTYKIKIDSIKSKTGSLKLSMILTLIIEIDIDFWKTLKNGTAYDLATVKEFATSKTDMLKRGLNIDTKGATLGFINYTNPSIIGYLLKR